MPPDGTVSSWDGQYASGRSRSDRNVPYLRTLRNPAFNVHTENAHRKLNLNQHTKLSTKQHGAHPVPSSANLLSAAIALAKLYNVERQCDGAPVRAARSQIGLSEKGYVELEKPEKQKMY